VAGLVDQLRNLVEADYEKLKGQLEERGKKIPASMETLYQTLKTVHAGSDGDDVIVTERYPTIFQITEQLSQQVALETSRLDELTKTGDSSNERSRSAKRRRFERRSDARQHHRKFRHWATIK